MTLGVFWAIASVTVAKGDQAYIAGVRALTNVSSGNTILPGWSLDTAAASASREKRERPQLGR